MEKTKELVSLWLYIFYSVDSVSFNFNDFIVIYTFLKISKNNIHVERSNYEAKACSTFLVVHNNNDWL